MNELKFTPSGHLFISSQDDCRATVDAMIGMDYSEEFCIALDFSPEFVSKLMEAGFLVMSVNLEGGEDADPNVEPYYILLPKLHLERCVLFFDDLHVKRSIRRLLSRYELRPDADFDRIIDRCVEVHGGDWLTPPLVDCIKKIRKAHPRWSVAPQLEFGGHSGGTEANSLEPMLQPYPASFALYRDGKLAAGEFGVICGNVYTSYSGFYEEDNAGTVQLILAARHLQEKGFSFFDLGMPLDYKADLGAVEISPAEFIKLFRGEENEERAAEEPSLF